MKNSKIETSPWKDATSEFPPLEKRVLGYYELPEKNYKQKPTGKMYQYYLICSVRSVTETLKGKSAEWEDIDLNPVTPEYWTDLPPAPKIKKLKVK